MYKNYTIMILMLLSITAVSATQMIVVGEVFTQTW